MNSHSAVYKFFLSLLLSVMIILQILLMVQTNRLNTRLNGVIKTLEASVGKVAEGKLVQSS